MKQLQQKFENLNQFEKAYQSQNGLVQSDSLNTDHEQFEVGNERQPASNHVPFDPKQLSISSQNLNGIPKVNGAVNDVQIP